jgi:hypothetical protein
VKAIQAAAHMHKVSYQAAAKVADFEQAGANAAAGYAAGISAGDIKAIQAAAHMGKISAQAAAKAIESSSPSKVFKRIGSSVPEGYALGVKGGLPSVAAIGKDLAAALGSGFSGYQGTLAKQFKGSTLTALDSLGRQLNAAADRYRADVQARRDMRTSIASGLLGAADISNLSLSNTGGGSIRGNNATLIAQLTRENKDVARLRRLHLDPTYLQQIASASPGQGVALAEDILSGREGSIGGLNKQLAQLRSLSGGIGATVSIASFASAIGRDEKNLERIAHALVAFVHKKLDLSASAEHAMERAFERSIRRAMPTLNIKDLDRALGIQIVGG